MRWTKFVGMEYFGSRDETTEQASVGELARCSVYVGIFGHRYGSGITEQEYKRARELTLECLIYFKEGEPAAVDGVPVDKSIAAKKKLAALKNKLRKHTITLFRNPDDLAAKVTADLNRWLYDAYLPQKLEGVLTGDLSASNAEALLAAVRDMSSLSRELLERLRAAGQTSPYIDATPVFRRVELDRYVGRAWLTRQIDQFIKENSQGYLILEATAGWGKTAYLASLVRQRNCIHHFAELAPGVDGILISQRNLAAQLTAAWRLQPGSADRQQDALRPGYLEQLLFTVARQRDETQPGEPILIAVDALDEAGTPFGQNVLGLPRRLPNGVYIIVSQRPVQVALSVDVPRLVFHFHDDAEENLKDMREYLRRAAERMGAITPDFDTECFVQTLLVERCQGNWMYLHYVIGEIESGRRSMIDLPTLPRGIWQYYAAYWQRWRAEHTDNWNTIHLPLLSALAAIQQPVSLDFLCDLAGVKASAETRRLLDEEWSPFLVPIDGDIRKYRFHHMSVREFLTGRADPKEMTRHEQSFAQTLASSALQAHSQIADRYLVGWGGFQGNLEALRDPKARDRDDGYGLRWVGAHLEAAGRREELHALLAVEWRSEQQIARRQSPLMSRLRRLFGRSNSITYARLHNAWYTVHEEVGDLPGYWADLHRAWQLARQATRDAVSPGQRSLYTALEIRYALMAASIHSVVQDTSAGLLLALVDKGIWSLEHGLHYAQAIQNPASRATALMGLAPRCSDERRMTIQRQAIDAAAEIKEAQERSATIVKIVEKLPDSLRAMALEEALAATMNIESIKLPVFGSEHAKLEAIETLAPHLDSRLAKRCLEEARMESDLFHRARWIAGLAQRLRQPVRSDLLKALENATAEIVNSGASKGGGV